MRTISCQEITDKVAQLVADTNYYLPDDVLNEIIRFRARETENLPISILDQIIENARIASEEQLPLCQDTGIAVFFVEIGIGVYVDGPGIEDAINEGVRRGHRDGGLRMSIVGDPLKRGNTGDNTPAVVHYTIVPGDSLNIMFCPKGGGCENMSRTAMLDPGDGREGVVDFVVDTVRIAGGKPCPPVIVGVGIGGNFEKAAILSKRVLMRTVGERHPDPWYSRLETELLQKINRLGIGPMGLGGNTTALDVFIQTAPCHIASLPVAVNIQCHSARHGHIFL